MHDSARPDDGRTDDEGVAALPVGRSNDDPDPERPVAETALVARVERYEEEADECTIHPADADDEELVTTWISAKGGSYVGLDEMR